MCEAFCVKFIQSQDGYFYCICITGCFSVLVVRIPSICRFSLLSEEAGKVDCTALTQFFRPKWVGGWMDGQVGVDLGWILRSSGKISYLSFLRCFKPFFFPLLSPYNFFPTALISTPPFSLPYHHYPFIPFTHILKHNRPSLPASIPSFTSCHHFLLQFSPFYCTHSLPSSLTLHSPLLLATTL